MSRWPGVPAETNEPFERFTELAPISGALCERRQDMNRLPNLDSSWGIAVVRMIMGFVLIITGYEKLISESQCCDAQESNPISHRDGRLHHRTGASWRVFAFDWFGRALAGTPLHWRIFGGELLHPSAHPGLDGCSPSDHVIGRRVNAVPVRLW